jgi:hypothetical protein
LRETLAMPLRTPLLLLLVVTVLLTACSRVGLAYRNLDWLIPWKLDDYLPLNAEQSAWLKPRLQQHLAWHCSVELPRYLEWLAGNQALLDQPDEAQLNAQLDAFADAVQRLAVQLTPTATDLLRSLSPYQVEQLFAALEQQNAKLHEEYVAPSREQQIARRAQRMEERLQPWFGSLKQDQRDRPTAWTPRTRSGWTTAWPGNRPCATRWRCAAGMISRHASAPCCNSASASIPRLTGPATRITARRWPSCSMHC